MNNIVPQYSVKSIKNGFSINTSYVSLINPFLLSNYSFENYKRFSVLKPNEKIYVKQSYMILTWFHYLTFLDALDKKIIKSTKKSSFKFFIAPKIYKKFTITKAPIAHKTRSKEQILFSFFRFNILFYVYSLKSIQDFFFYTSSNHALFSILLSKQTISLSETNLLFLRRKRLQLSFIDPKYFSYK